MICKQVFPIRILQFILHFSIQSSDVDKQGLSHITLKQILKIKMGGGGRGRF